MSTKDEELEAKKAKLNESSRSDLRDFEAYYRAEFASAGSDYELKLYRCEPSGRKIKTTFIERFFEIPSEELIGKKYGGGHYRLRGIHPLTDEDHSKEIYIDELWTKVKRDEDRRQHELTNGTTSPVPNPQADPLTVLLTAAEKLAPIIKSMFGNRVEAPAMGATSMIEGVNKVMISGMESINKMQLNAAREIQQQKRDMMEMDTVKDESIGKDIVGMIKSFGDKFLEAKGPTAAMYESMIKNNPKYQDMIEDEDILSAVYTEAIADSGIGKQKIEDLFKKLNIEIPEDAPAEQQPATK